MNDVVWVVLDTVMTETGEVVVYPHVHRTEDSALKFIAECLEEDPEADFELRECTVYSDDDWTADLD